MSSSCSALPLAPPLAPPPLEPSATCKTEFGTGEIVEQQVESKRRREHPEVFQAADSSSSISSSSESSNDTEMGFVDAEAAKRERVSGKILQRLQKGVKVERLT